MVELKDEILDTSSQKVNVPLYNIKDENGNNIYTKVQIHLDTPVIQEGNYLNKAFWEEIGFHVGMIIMWSGSIDTIPSGWQICDGTNGTPDLRNRFIVGAGSSYSVGNKGGSNSVTLTTSQIPSHTHSMQSSGAHTHTYDGMDWEYRRYDSGSSDSVVGDEASSTTGSSGAHTHTIDSTGGGGSHENRPPYYALAYIMKI